MLANQRREQFASARIKGRELPGDSLILEIGSGTGWLLNRLGRCFPQVRFSGVEPIGAYVQYARKQAPPNVQYIESTLDEPPTFRAVRC